jgi:hypothetical protein
MDQIIIEMLKAAPAAAAVIVIVIVFLKHIDKRDVIQQERDMDVRLDMRVQTENSREFQENLIARLEKVAVGQNEALDRNTTAINKLLQKEPKNV